MKKNKMNKSGQQQMNEQDKQKEYEKAPGYGDKRLEGPNRPSV